MYPISHNEYPAQGEFIGKRIFVSFNYDTKHSLPGTVIRDDDEDQ